VAPDTSCQSLDLLLQLTWRLSSRLGLIGGGGWLAAGLGRAVALAWLRRLRLSGLGGLASSGGGAAQQRTEREWRRQKGREEGGARREEGRERGIRV